MTRIQGIQCETLISIFAQQQQEVNKKTHHRHKAGVARYVERYERGESLLHIAVAVDLSPVQLVCPCVQ